MLGIVDGGISPKSMSVEPALNSRAVSVGVGVGCGPLWSNSGLYTDSRYRWQK